MIASGSQFRCLQGPVQEWGQYPDLVDKRAASTVAVAQQVWFPSFSFTSMSQVQTYVRLPSFPHWHQRLVRLVYHVGQFPWCELCGEWGRQRSPLPLRPCLASSLHVHNPPQASPWRRSCASPSIPMSWAPCRQRTKASLSVL